mgnify:CR=1 FL=1
MKPARQSGKNGRFSPANRALRNDRGDVLLEYVLLTVLIILPLVGVSIGLVNVSGQVFSPDGPVQGDDFGLLGNAFVNRYRMVMSGISLPLP